MEAAHVQAFGRLRPLCVELSQVALRHQAKTANEKQVIQSLEALCLNLRQVSQVPGALNPKISEYVFFPLTYIFRGVKEYSTRAIEVAVQCTEIIIKDGWKKQLPPSMAKQLLILLCFIAGGSPTESRVKDIQEDLGSALFHCLSILFQASPDAGLAEDGAIQAESVPILGHTVVVLLDGILEGPSASVRFGALEALHRAITGVPDRGALRNVLPGIVSALTKMLSGKVNPKPPSKMVIAALKTLDELLCRVLGDPVVSLPQDRDTLETSNASSIEEKERSWLKGTVAQMKMALANILSQRSHPSPEVQSALLKFCISIIQHCRKTLQQSIAILLEAVVVILGQSDKDDLFHLTVVEGLLADDFTLQDILKSSLHDWIVSLPRIFQTRDDAQKHKVVGSISAGLKLLSRQGTETSVLSDTLAWNLRTSLSNALNSVSTSGIGDVPSTNLEVSKILASPRTTDISETFQPVLFNMPGHQVLLGEFERFFNRLAKLPVTGNLQQSLASSLRTSSGDDQLICFWLLLKILDAELAEIDLINRYINPSATSTSRAAFLEDVYSFALDVLSRSTFENEEQWRVQALSLEAVAFSAHEHGEAFRPELVDCLYPILERLGSNNFYLQRHAINCLTVVTNSCAYVSPAVMIVDNADYLINAVSLKLNTFSITPQAPQVLVMIVRLCGAPLIPYLDDIIESIFSILSCYHGYPKLVESLFSVLSAVTDEANKIASRTIEHDPRGITKAQHHVPTRLSELIVQLRILNLSIYPPSPSSPPTAPSSQNPPSIDDRGSLEESDTPEPSSTSEPSAAPKTKTLSLLEQIVSLTPAHLTIPLTALRISLLQLLRDSLPTIAAANADTFLPLAATLFPIISTRIFDSMEDLPVILAAAEAMTALCSSSGDFVSSRVGDEGWWGKLKSLMAKSEDGMNEELRIWTRGQPISSSSSSSSLTSQEVDKRMTTTTLSTAHIKFSGPSIRIWLALIDLLLAIARDVGVESEQEDDLFEILAPLVVSRALPTAAMDKRINDKAQRIEKIPPHPHDPKSNAKENTSFSQTHRPGNKTPSTEADTSSITTHSKLKSPSSTPHHDEQNNHTSLQSSSSTVTGAGTLILPTSKKLEIKHVLETVNADLLWLYEERASTETDVGD